MTAQQDAAQVLAAHLTRRHFYGTGCGTNGTGGCVNCFGPSPMSAREVAEVAVDALAAAGLLVTPEHDAQVAARALRDFATRCDGQAADAHHGGGAFRLYAEAWTHAAEGARCTADRIERQGEGR